MTHHAGAEDVEACEECSAQDERVKQHFPIDPDWFPQPANKMGFCLVGWVSGGIFQSNSLSLFEGMIIAKGGCTYPEYDLQRSCT